MKLPSWINPFNGEDTKTENDADGNSAKILSRVITLSGVHDGEEKKTTFYTLPDRPKDMAEWDAKMQLESEGWSEIDVVDSEVRLHD